MMKMTEFSAHFRLTNKIATLIKAHVSIKRELPIMKASRVYSGPEVRGTRPVLVTFETFKDRDEVLRKVSSVGFNEFVSIILLSQARLLKKANVHVEEDLSKRTRENRAELRKFMRQVSSQLWAAVGCCGLWAGGKLKKHQAGLDCQYQVIYKLSTLA